MSTGCYIVQRPVQTPTVVVQGPAQLEASIYMYNKNVILILQTILD